MFVIPCCRYRVTRFVYLALAQSDILFSWSHVQLGELVLWSEPSNKMCHLRYFYMLHLFELYIHLLQVKEYSCLRPCMVFLVIILKIIIISGKKSLTSNSFLSITRHCKRPRLNSRWTQKGSLPLGLKNIDLNDLWICGV